MEHHRMLTLHFVDNTKLTFSFPKQADSSAAKQVKLDSLWEGKHLIIEADGAILVFPIANIKYFQFSAFENIAAQANLPAHTIRGASLMG